jgi:hypothetical protein
LLELTAQMLVGTNGTRPADVLWLSENGQAYWVLQEVRRAGDSDSPAEGSDAGKFRNQHPCALRREIVWVPEGPQNILEDGLLLVGLHVLRAEALLELVRTTAPSLLEKEASELEETDSSILADLRTRCRQITIDRKLVLTVLHGSTVRQQLHLLERYRMEIEVCTVSYRRFWTGLWGRHDDLQSEGDLWRPSNYRE